jgi:hypothetical protein
MFSELDTSSCVSPRRFLKNFMFWPKYIFFVFKNIMTIL